MAIDTNSLVALRATKLLLTPTQSRDYILITAQFDKIVCKFIVNYNAPEVHNAQESAEMSGEDRMLTS